MRYCTLCKKKYVSGSVSLFHMPRDVAARDRWSEICGKNFLPSSLLCSDHFLSRSIIKTANKMLLLPSAEPIIMQWDGVAVINSDALDLSGTEVNLNVAAPKDPDNTAFRDQEEELPLNSNNNIIPPQLQEEPIIQIPVIKSISCSGSTQTNTRLCGLIEASDLADEYRFICFYCSEVFPIEKWKTFVNHLKSRHLEVEEALKITKYVSEDHDYTPIRLPLPSPSEPGTENDDVDNKPLLPFSVDPLETAHNPFESVVLNPSIYYLPDQHKTKKSLIYNKNETKPKVTALSRCLKRTNAEDMEQKYVDQHEPVPIEIATPTEICFEFTPGNIIDSLLDSMKNYPVLWQFDGEPFNEDFFEAVEDLCKIINEKWSLSIDNLKMRRSINRILRLYCYLFPNENVENVHQFTSYYDKLAAFLPSSVNDVAYARCSHCYICYKNDFELKLHLVEEQKYLEWPYKCERCKECFRQNEEYEFHKQLPHYDEIFTCAPCNKTFFHRDLYSKHIVTAHVKDNEPNKYQCNICDKEFQSNSTLRYHLVHHGERKYKCHLCPKSYYSNGKLVLHLKSHRKEYDFICEVCGKGFILQSNLREHMKMHTGAKVNCSICNLRLRKSSLSRHLRIVHVAFEGSVETTVKGRNLYYRRLIRSKPLRPIQRKSGERNYHCKICKINFESYKLTVEHNKEVHSNTPRWPCKMCSTEFSQKLNLKRHYRKKHNLHVIQVFKLVDENVDLDAVLAMKPEHLEQLAETLIDLKGNVTKSNVISSLNSKNKSDNVEKSKGSKGKMDNLTKSLIKNNFLQDGIYFEEDKIHSSTIQDEIMKAADNIETQEIQIDLMNDFFTDLFKEQ